MQADGAVRSFPIAACSVILRPVKRTKSRVVLGPRLRFGLRRYQEDSGDNQRQQVTARSIVR